MNEANRLLNNNYGTCMVTMVQYNVYVIQSVDAMRTYDKVQAKMWKIGIFRCEVGNNANCLGFQSGAKYDVISVICVNQMLSHFLFL